MTLDTIDPETVEKRLRENDSIADILADSEYQTTWTNHWDANPDEHGGCFVRFDSDGGYFDVVVTNPPGNMPEGFADGRHLFEDFVIYPDEDIWDEAELLEAVNNAPESFERDPYAGYTDDARRFAEQYSSGGPDSALDLPGAKGLLFDFHGYYGAYHLNGRDNWVEQSDYWETLEDKHGITEDNA